MVNWCCCCYTDPDPSENKNIKDKRWKYNKLEWCVHKYCCCGDSVRCCRILLVVTIVIVLLVSLVAALGYSALPIPIHCITLPESSGDSYHRIFMFNRDPSNTSNISIIMFSDVQIGYDVHKHLVDRMLDIEPSPQLLVSGGDSVPYSMSFFWWRYFAIEEPICSIAPLLAARGNHDGTRKQYSKYFGVPDEAHFSIVIPPIGFIVIYSETGDIDDEAEWLNNAIHEVKQTGLVKYLIAVMHRPPISSGWHGNADWLAPIYNRLVDPLHNVSLLFTGHEHSYERITPGENTGNYTLPMIIFGGAGSDLRSAGINPTIGRFEETYGFLWLHSESGAIVIDAINEDGIVFDRAML